VWLSNTEVHIERIHYDDVFFQQHLSTAEVFFKTCILPELIAKWFSMGRSASIPSDVATSDQCNSTVCFCMEMKVDGMVECHGDNCSFNNFFHLKCLGLKNYPRSKKYLCPNCSKLARATKNALKRKAPC
jgi:hypothetical protein